MCCQLHLDNDNLVANPSYPLRAAIRHALEDPAPPVVDAAITAIGRLHDEASRPRLRALLKDKNPYYCGNALLARNDPQYREMATVLADDRLWVNSDSGVCTQLFAVELSMLA